MNKNPINLIKTRKTFPDHYLDLSYYQNAQIQKNGIKKVN